MTTREEEERAVVARKLRHIAGSVVLLGEAWGRRLLARPRLRALVEEASHSAGAACVKLAARAAREPPPSHPRVEAQLLSVYGVDVEIPALAWEMAINVEIEKTR